MLQELNLMHILVSCLDIRYGGGCEMCFDFGCMSTVCITTRFVFFLLCSQTQVIINAQQQQFKANEKENEMKKRMKKNGKIIDDALMRIVGV